MSKFIPKAHKFQKLHKGRLANKITSTNTKFLAFKGILALKVLSYGRLPNNELVSFYNCVNKIIKKNGKIRLNTISYIPITKKPIETRMGKGKGNISTWISKLRVGSILCEINISSITLGIKALVIAKKKLSLKTKIISI